MAGLELHTGNRLETLADELARVLRRPLSSPFRADTLIVPSPGMARWLKLELARRNGVWANATFPFPAAFCDQLFRTVFPETAAGGESPFAPQMLVWRIMARLPALATRPGFDEIRHYLGDGRDGRKRFQLAARLASLFDQYLLHRPDWITAWDAGRERDWQAGLWREIDPGVPHLPARFTEFARRLARPDAAAQAALPERVCVFGISSLPEFHLAVLGALAAQAEVHCFLLQPSREYWGLIASPREQQRLARRAGVTPDALHLETGNRLLASLGKLGRDFLNLLLDAGDWTGEEHFEEPPEDSLLHTIQADLFHLRDRGRDGTPRLAVAVEDDSLRVHSCHSPLRELEVLQDHLLDWFQRDPTLAPREVLVMTPDIDAYAPFIQAVFDAPEAESRRIPFSVADRGARRESPVVDTFLRLLNLPLTRLTAADVLAPLDTPAVRSRFGLGEADVDLVRGWVRDANIRWGLDAAHRRALELPAFAENTWQHGLDRLLLGYALAGDGTQLFQEILPAAGVEGAAAETLGHFLDYFDRLRQALAALGAARPVAEWSRVLGALLGDCFMDDDATHAEIVAVRAALRDLGRRAAAGGFDEPVPLAVVLEPLTAALAEDRFGTGFLTGGVTFCALKPMRSIPFKVICLIGMNDTAFPRTDARPAFDRMAREPRPGDRSLREEDRYLFLETLLSARERLHLSFVGQSIRDNSPAPPSVMVSELLDYVGQAFDVAPDSLITRHRLQAFSPAYFDGSDPRWFSFSAENCAAGEATRHPRAAPPGLFTEPLGEPEPELREVDVESLAEFFRNPAKFLLTRRLGLRLPYAEEPLEATEPFALDALAAHQVRQELVEWRLAGRDLARHADVLRAAGRLPPGEPGVITFQGLRAEAEEFAARVAPFVAGGFGPPMPVDLAVGEFRLTGQLAVTAAGGCVGFRCAKVKAADRLRHWIQHLAWSAMRPQSDGGESVFVAKDVTLRFREVGQPLATLGELLALYWRGLRQPLKFFPQSAHALVVAERKQQSGSKAKREPIDAARAAWEGDAFSKARAEREEPWFDLCFHHGDPLDEEFVATARRVFEPLLAGVEEVEP